MMAVAKGVLISEPTYDAITSATSKVVPLATLAFWLSRTSGGLQLPAIVYQDGGLMTPFPSNIVTATSTGLFPAIYTNPSVPLRVQLFNASGHLIQDVDPYVLNSRFIYTAYVQANESQTSSVALITDEYLVIPIPYAGTYRYELQAEFVTGSNSGTNPNANFGVFLEGGGQSGNLFNVIAQSGGLLQDVATVVQIPGGITAFAADMMGDPAGGTTYPSGTNVNGVTDYPITLSTTTHTPVHITGMFTCTMPCKLAFAWSPNVSSSVALTLLAGSYLKVQSIQSTVTPGIA